MINKKKVYRINNKIFQSKFNININKYFKHLRKLINILNNLH
jgi:hypothetical protein